MARLWIAVAAVSTMIGSAGAEGAQQDKKKPGLLERLGNAVADKAADAADKIAEKTLRSMGEDPNSPQGQSIRRLARVVYDPRVSQADFDAAIDHVARSALTTAELEAANSSSPEDARRIFDAARHRCGCTTCRSLDAGPSTSISYAGCSTCGGAGKIPCSSCQGYAGRKWVVCGFCQGEKTVWTDDGADRAGPYRGACPTCRGEGGRISDMTCGACGRSGTVTCYACDGTGSQALAEQRRRDAEAAARLAELRRQEEARRAAEEERKRRQEEVRRRREMFENGYLGTVLVVCPRWRFVSVKLEQAAERRPVRTGDQVVLRSGEQSLTLVVSEIYPERIVCRGYDSGRGRVDGRAQAWLR
ncbi:MAG: hypothetical protein L0216_21415 [Planctomycetales bacterium]|nr:hypothetical protein [Planctomycetales bacterium]